MAVVGLDGYVEVKVDATVGSHSKIIDAARLPEMRPLPRPSTMRSKHGPVKSHRFFAGRSIHAHAVLFYSGEIELEFVIFSPVMAGF